MQNVSQAWKDNQNNTLVCESDIEISIKLTDPDAYEDTTASDNGHPYFSNTEHIVSDGDKMILPYATLETNQWLLDGSREIIPNNGSGETGYIGGALSTATGVYSTNPVVSVNFTTVHTKLLEGVTIRWSEFLNEYAIEFIVTAYNGETVVAQKTITDNTSVLSIIKMDISTYDKITIEVVRWSMAFRRARIDEILIGIMHIYSKSNVFSYSASHSVNPISAELPKSDISFSIDNVDDSYNPYNTNGLSKYLMERQAIDVRYGYKLSTGIEWIKGGRFYISEWDAKQNGIRADFKARDLLEFMTGTYYRGIYSPNGMSLYDMATDVLQDADLPANSDGSVKWVIDERLKNIYSVAPLPIDTHANCLQLIANASESVLYQDRQGVLRLEHITFVDRSSSDYDVSLFNSYSKSNLSLSKPLKQVDVPCYSYSTSANITELYNDTVDINGTVEMVINYSSTATNVSTIVTGGTLKSATYYSNACVLTITATGSVTILVKGYSLESSSVITSTPSGALGEIVTVDNMLITNRDRALAVGSWVESYMKNRMTLSSQWRADPRLDALDIVNNENDYNTNKVLMTKVQYSYNGAFRGSGEGRVV